MRSFCATLLVGLLGAGACPAWAEEAVPLPLRGVEIEPRLGTQVPVDVPFVDQEGRPVRLRDYLRPGRPLVLTLNYYGCPTLCSIHLQGVLKALRALTFTVGKEFQMVTVSIDPREGPQLAAAKRKTYLEALGRDVPEGSWAFLTGREQDIRALADAVGFRYRYDERTRQYAHAAGIFVLTPQGRLSQVLYGIELAPRDLRLALVEASRGVIGTPVDRLLLLCFQYDPARHSYAPTAMGIMRLAGAVTVLVLGLLILTMWRRERRTSVVQP
ncbi:MAG: SCO family protein [Myxococcales bacterium]|nr:SCO family protein [Myxococcota bacterium]MDW8282716.1 SCO family protein [Myxococcales bacterium]